MDGCPACGFELRPGARFCPRCGNPVPVVNLQQPVVTGPPPSNDPKPAPPEEKIVSPGAPLPEESVPPEASPSPQEVARPVQSATADDGEAKEMKSPGPAPKAPLYDYEPLLHAIERLFRFLGEDMKEKNYQNIAEVRQSKGHVNAGLKVRLSSMCRLIARQVVENYVSEQSEKYLADGELELAMMLAEYAVRNSTGNTAINARKFWCALKALCLAQSGQLAPSAIIERMREQSQSMGPQPEASDSTGALPWTEIAQVIAAYLRDQRRVNNLMPEVARQWIEVYSPITEIAEATRKALLDAAHQHIPQETDPLSFLKQEDRARLRDHLRHLRFEQLRALLHREQAALLQAFSEALYDPYFAQVLPPRRSTHVVFRRVELIPEIKKYMASQDEKGLEQALQLLEYAQRDIIDREHAPVVREWLLYVRARAQQLNRAIPEWQADATRGMASWEEIWNLAVASFQENNALPTLQVLIPGIKSLRAPFSHLRLGLFCAITILRRKTGYQKQTLDMVEAFLLDNLVKLPVPLSYLTWLWLANDSAEPLEHRQQLPVIDVFHEIVGRPILYNRPARPAQEISIEEFDRDFQELLATVHKLERDYVLEAGQESITLKTRMLETSIRISHGVPRRVGIFVDYENLILSLPKEMRNRSDMIAKTLQEHGHKYGEVVHSWLCYSPANLRNIYEYDMVSKFQQAGFKIEVPRGTTGNLRPGENQSDFVLLECITSAMIDSKLDVYVIVSGDHMYYDRIRRLLERGNAVCVISHPQMLSGRYSRLLDNIQKSYMPEDYGEFSIDALDEVFHFTPEQVMALDAEIKKRTEEKIARK